MKKLLLGLFLIGSTAYATAPVVYFSDLDSGPNYGGRDNNGVHIYIRGKYFGATQGAGTVTIGGGEVATYDIWVDSEIYCQIGGSAATGNIVVTTSEGASNGIAFTVRDGDIYYISERDGGTNEGTYENPYTDAGDYYDLCASSDGCTGYFREGVYNGQYGLANWHGNFVLQNTVSGIEGYPNAFVGYLNEYALITTTNTDADQHNFRAHSTQPGYITIAGLHLNAKNCCVTATSGSTYPGWRVVHNDCDGLHAYTASGIIVVSSDSYRVLGNVIHGGSSHNKLDHAIYPNEGIDGEIAWNIIEGNSFKEGPMISINHDSSALNNWIFEVDVHDNYVDVSSAPSRCLGIYEIHPGSTVTVRNNVFKGSPPSGSYTTYCIEGWIYYYNNTFVDSGGANNVGSMGVNSYTVHDYYYEPEYVEISNNIIYSTPTASWYIRNTSGTVVVSNNNLIWGLADWATDTQNAGDNTNGTNTNPGFFDYSGADYHLTSTSTCKNTGLTITAVDRDYDGLTRPQGAAYDIGAYEYPEEAPPGVPFKIRNMPGVWIE